MVRNESDIIESFVRYHTALLDEMIFLDNGSTDGTGEVLKRLQAEGFPIHLIFDPNPTYSQAATITSLTQQAFKDLAAELVLPLDADEFVIENQHGNNPRWLLEQLPQDVPAYVEWLTYVPTVQDDWSQLNPIVRIKHRREKQHNHDSKVIIPRRFWLNIEGASIHQGNHYVLNESGARLRIGTVEHSLAYAHYPIRNQKQARTKYLVGWLANLARPDRVLFDWYTFYNQAKHADFSVDDLTDLARHYNVLDKDVTIDLVLDPLDISFVPEMGVAPKYANGRHESLTLLLDYCEYLAERLSAYQGRTTVGHNDYSDQMVLQIIRNYELIEGWLSPREAIQLYRLSREELDHPPVVCEIGSWVGRSSYILARGIEWNPEGKVYCIDPFDGRGDLASAKVYKACADQLSGGQKVVFQNNMARFGVASWIETLSMASEEALEFVPDDIDLLFIDGNHAYEAVLLDFRLWGPRVRPGGWIVFHDVGAAHVNGPKEVVETQVVSSPDWEENVLIDELFAARRVKR